MKKHILCVPVIAVVLAAVAEFSPAQTPVGTAFTYQGQLKQSGVPVDGSADLVFMLFDAATTPPGNQVGPTLTFDGAGGNPGPVNIANGLFTLALDFGAGRFAGDARYLEIAVRYPAGGGGYTTLTPRQELSAAPYAHFGLDTLKIRGREVDTASPGNGQALKWDGAAWAPANDSDTTYTAGTGLTLASNQFALDTAYADGRYVNEGQVSSITSAMLLDGGVANADLANGAVTTLKLGSIAGYTLSTSYAGTLLSLTNSNANRTTLACWASYNNGTAVYGYADDSGTGVYGGSWYGTGVKGQSDSGSAVYGLGNSGYGVNGQSTSNYGVYGTSSTNDGIYGSATASNKAGVRGVGSTSASGVIGTTSFVSGFGVYATNTGGGVAIKGENSGNGDALYGVTTGTSTTAHGVRGTSTNGLGGIFQSTTNDGLKGLTSANGHYGVYGSGSAGTADGVYGQAATNGRGVYGQSSGGIGVYGYSGSGVAVEGYGFQERGGYFHTDTSTVYGLEARSASGSSTNKGLKVTGTTDLTGNVAITGNLTVSGSVSKGSGSFVIDHPLDPVNKYLYHSFVESPDMMNVYNGNIVTDERGYATITLPDWFGALNRDFRYQLTVIGQFAQAMVAEEIKDHRFVIQTDRPNVKVSWQVTGIRQDALANAHRIPVEEDKRPEDRGKYLHPEAYGQPAEMGVDYARHRAVEERVKQDAAASAESPSVEQQP